MGYTDEYNRKLVSADEAVKVVKSGDWVAYSHFAMTPVVLDEALAKRKDELTNVKVRGICSVYPVKVALADPDQQHFIYNNGFFSGYDRKLQDHGLAYFMPGLYEEAPAILRTGQAERPNVAMIVTTPMDESGYFNFSVSNSYERAATEKAETVIVEVNRNAPRCLGGDHESIHISEVDYIVEGNHNPLFEVPSLPATEVDKKIASLIVEEIEDGACLQLGIGGMPNTIGQMLAESGLKDLGVHSEMLCDAFVDLYEKGKITGARKTIDRFKMVFTFALGSKRLYEFIHNNPACAIYPVDYTNSPAIIAQNDKQISINNAIEIDLYGQVCSETVGARQISGTGGQFDFAYGAFRSKGGKSFICLGSTKKVKDTVVSRIVPTITPGNIVTLPRSVVQYVVTEHGKANLKGKPTWQRAEMLISIADPEYREDLIKQAEKMKIWTKTNKKI
ncbi:acetyl-CoA hydrolase/transferase family protein [Desulfotruncus alcoholivorax]|uniref:acetyl-CoA hydrolase/transferase family protein n=1 Tax=Desulfotruncus alcoholivorax TaxID=265477 RepID=UPI0004083C78|nr:acetyl-CoA hydrolase/transferase C-terminal domain-containing protein [Desulfotruncus alcoholivorax]